MEEEEIIKIENCRFLIHCNKKHHGAYLNLNVLQTSFQNAHHQSNILKLIGETNLTVSPHQLVLAFINNYNDTLFEIRA